MRQKIDTARLPNAVLAKWSSKSLNEGFVPFPKKLLRCMPQIFTGENGVEELAVVLAIIDYRRPNLTREPSLEFLAFIAGMDQELFEKRLGELETRKLLKVGGNKNEMNIDLSGLLKKIDALTSTTEDKSF